MLICPIAHIKSPYLAKFGVPRQPGIISCVSSSISFADEKAYARCIEALDGSSWLMVIWGFSQNGRVRGGWRKSVRPPILGGSERMGVFATRSSFRPNGLALSIVEAEETCNMSIKFRGGDMVDGSPVYEILAYDPHAHAVLDARGGWQESSTWKPLDDVVFPDDMASMPCVGDLRAIREVLIQDPRPSHTHGKDADREFWTAFDNCLIRFKVIDDVLFVTELRELRQDERQSIRQAGKLPEATGRATGGEMA